ncbi:hypothetical protein [Sphingomonas nostoxanthinifaciens]|uniref:hypothetical protein n=1 Tax=Sphingomonas nostoxanthinifaciens TaxID=2872652 RepID=UPI001CC1CD22|nr:hypothetical protein [Sphingomonas nostoxanthinifaciens]UAK23756.1 hypothetical protein K8P63_15430 [Sphingomonas nostoxanthinifaciens]
MPNWFLAAPLIYDAALVACCGYAVAVGGRPERIGAGIAIAASGASDCVILLRHWSAFDASDGLAMVDLGTLIAFDALMVRSRRHWPIFVTGVQLASVTIDLAMLLSPIPLRPYLRWQGKFAYPILMALAAGAFRYHRRKMIASRSCEYGDPN